MKKVININKIPIKLWLDNIEDGALEQAHNLANLFYAWRWIALMPDCHQGYGMPIGGVMATVNNIIVPNAVGVDIGCGMAAIKLSINEIDIDAIKKIMKEIRKAIPVGFNHNKEPQKWDKFNCAPDIEIIQKELISAQMQLGTLGGGNHFIEIQKGNDNHIWIMLHSGSRNFGYKTAKTYHDKAKKICERYNSDIPTLDLSFLSLDTKEGQEYYTAMNYCLDFAQANRTLMMKKITDIFWQLTHAKTEREVNIHHNYAAIENHFGKNVFIHRKGATKAYIDQAGIIPGSQGTKSYIVKGRGNLESFKSCSHGAGRVMGRKEARRQLNIEHEKELLKNVIHSLRNENDLEEAPSAYKDIDIVMQNQIDLVEIEVELTPLAVIKG